MRRTIHLISGMMLMISIAWLDSSRDFEPLQSFIGSLIAFCSSFERKSSKPPVPQARVDRQAHSSDAALCNLFVIKVLAKAPGYGKTEAFLHSAVNSMSGGGVTLQEVRDAIEKNHKNNLIRSERDDEGSEVRWFITTAGLARNKQ